MDLIRCLLLLAAILLVVASGEAQPLVPAMVIFGDSLVDVGNNDYLDSIGKANMPPYGRDFKDHVATGRYCNGKLAIDIIGWIDLTLVCHMHSSLIRQQITYIALQLKGWGSLATPLHISAHRHQGRTFS
jgi:hypothetical protein